MFSRISASLKKIGIAAEAEGILFILPYAFFWGLFLVWPLIYGFYISLHKWDPLRGSKFIGLGNYANLLHDPRFWGACLHTFQFAGIAIPLIVILGLAFALLMKGAHLKGSPLVEASLFFPYLLTVSIIAMIWEWLLDPDFGLVLEYLSNLGLNPPTFLHDKLWVIPAIAFATAWWLAGYRMVIFRAALEDIPQELYEVADLDGASWFQKLWNITLPLLKPAILFAVVLTSISGFRVFGQVVMMTDGGPGTASEVLALYLYRYGFSFLEMGQAAATGFVLLLIILVVTIISFKFLGFESELRGR